MTRRLTFSLVVAILVAPLSIAAQHHQLGTVSFPTSCHPSVQAEFERGVAMLHSYWFTVAGRTFRGVLAQDPQCAIAYWGIALDLLGNTLAAPPPRDDARAAWEALEKARTLTVRTERERDWIDAARAYFRDHETRPVEERLQAYRDAMARLAARYPDDFEAQVYHALTLQAAASKRDMTYAHQLESATILERLYAQNPQHPGITHYLIHAYDFAPFAEKGIPSARRYASIAPAVPHARHMPAHIYSMVGMWEDSIRSNMSALQIQPDYFHAADFAVYAHLQLAQDRQAAALIERVLATPLGDDRSRIMVNQTALAAMPARYVIERADWKAAAALPAISTPHLHANALRHFTRGLGLARSGDVAGAKQETVSLETVRAAQVKAGDSYWADRTNEQILAVTAWIAHAEGADDRAATLMRQAADGEDGSIKHVAMENRLYPLRELLADLLLEAQQPQAALAEYETALKLTPNRYRGIYGAARAAEAAGDLRRAREYYEKLQGLAKNGDRAEMRGRVNKVE